MDTETAERLRSLMANTFRDPSGNQLRLPQVRGMATV
jgi:hypothetical protein